MKPGKPRTKGNRAVVGLPSTARRGNPGEASRGAAVARARRAFQEAHDVRVWALELEMYTELVGLPAGASRDQVAHRLDHATLDELEAWTAATKRLGMIDTLAAATPARRAS